MPDLGKLQPVANRVIKDGVGKGLDNLTDHDRVFLLLWSYTSVVDNGWFPAFFYNSPADHYSETVDALRRLELRDHSELLERAAAILFSSDVPRTTEEWNSAMDQLPDEVGMDEEFDELYDEYSACGGGDRVLETLQNWYFNVNQGR